MSDIITMTYHIICAYWYLEKRIYNQSIQTIYRGKTKKAPVAIHFKDYYFFGIRKEIDLVIIRKVTKYLVDNNWVIQKYNEKKRDYYFTPVNLEKANELVKYIIENKEKLLEKYE